MCGRLYLDTMHMDRVNLIVWYLLIWWFDLETGNTVATIRILRSFLGYAMNELMHTMQVQIDACDARTKWCMWCKNDFFFFLYIDGHSSHLQNRVSTMICESRFFILLAKTFETILYTTLPKLIGLYTEMSCGLFFFGIKAMCV